MTALLVALVLSQAPQPEPTVITSVEVRLPAGADAKLLERAPQLVTVRRGQRLSRRAISRSIESLFASGKFADIEVQADDGPEGVTVIFNLTPRQNIGVVFTEGQLAVSRAEIIGVTALEPGSEYWPERLSSAQDAVRELYRRRGYREAVIRAEAVPIEGAMTVGFVIEEGAPTRLTSLTFSGEPGLPLEELLQTIGLRPGAVLDLIRLDEGLERLRLRYRREAFYKAKVDAPEVDERGAVVVPVVSGPKYEVRFSGNRVISDRGLRAVLRYDGDETLDAALAERLAGRLERFYRFRGYHEVRVSPTEVQRGATAAALAFFIEEGRPLRVTQVVFEGAKVITASELREVLGRVVESAAPVVPFEAHSLGDPTDVAGHQSAVFAETLPAPAAETVLDEETWGQAAKAMVALYRERGYLSTTVVFAGAELAEGRATARFEVNEGPRATLKSVLPEGLPDGFSSDAIAAFRPGQTFSPQRLEQLEQDVSRELSRKGYLFATVKGAYRLDASGEHVDAVLTTAAGPQVKVRAVLPVGQVRTAEDVILRQATMKEGLPLDAESLYQTQANLTNLGIFRSVQVEMLSPERPEPLKTVMLRVRERALFQPELFIGYFYADGIRGGLEGAITNIGGRGITLTGRAQGNLFFTSAPALLGQVDLTGLEVWKQIGFRANVSLDARSVLPAGLGLRFDAVAERVFRPQFRFSRVAGLPTIDWSHTFEVPRVEWLRPKLTLALQYEAEWTFVESVGLALTALPPTSLSDQARLRFLFGEFVLHGGRITATLDLRDSPLNPRRGVLLQGATELTGALYALDAQGTPVTVNFIKASGLATGYLPIGPRVVFAVSARGGRIFPIADGSTTPPVRRFFLGGATTVRGFNEDQLVAEDSRTLYRQQVRDCQVLVNKSGCSSAAQTVVSGRQVPSQGGELFAVLKSELRFPAFSILDLGVFFELGNLWLAVPEALAFRPVVGSGLRVVTPIGPLALDVGVNLDPDLVINEPRFVAHFNIGVF